LAAARAVRPQDGPAAAQHDQVELAEAPTDWGSTAAARMSGSGAGDAGARPVSGTAVTVSAPASRCQSVLPTTREASGSATKGMTPRMTPVTAVTTGP
jgi:hypothetical protein